MGCDLQATTGSVGGRENPPTAPSVFNHSKAKDRPAGRLSLWTRKTNGLEAKSVFKWWQHQADGG